MELLRRHHTPAWRRRALIGAGVVVILAVALMLMSSISTDSPQFDLADDELPGMDIVHVVYAYIDSETVEMWIDPQTGDAIQTTTNDAGEVVAVMQRSGLTLSQYHVYRGASWLTTQTVLSKDDPALLIATLQLEGYRWGLESGGVVPIENGRTTYNGAAVIEVNAWVGGEMEHVALLDPDTLYPLAMFTPSGDQMPLTYTLIESLDRDAVDRSVFAFDYGEPQTIEVNTLLTLDVAAAFTAYPVSTLGDAFDDDTLDRVERRQSNANDARPAGDEVLVRYVVRDADEQIVESIAVRSRRALTDAERAEIEGAEAAGNSAPSEEVTLANGEIVRLRPRDTSSNPQVVWIEIDRPDGYVTIQAPDRETALRAAEALVRVNASVFTGD